MATRKIRNTTISDIFLIDFGNQVVKAADDPSGNDIFTFIDEESKIKRSSQIFDLIATGDLVVMDADDADITIASEGWTWVIKDTKEPPKTKDGDWHIVQENFAHVTGNETVNWTIERYLDVGTSFQEKFIVPNGRTLTLNFLEGGSFTVPTFVTLEWFEDIGGGNFMRRNPEVRLDELICMTVNGAHLIGETIININNTNNDLNFVELNLFHAIKSGTDNQFYKKIIEVDTVADTITLDSGLDTAIIDGTVITLTDRVVGQKGSQIANSIINWSSPPQFFGNGTNHLSLTIKNEDSVDAGLVTAMVNGWHTDTATGD